MPEEVITTVDNHLFREHCPENLMSLMMSWMTAVSGLPPHMICSITWKPGDKVAIFVKYLLDERGKKYYDPVTQEAAKEAIDVKVTAKPPWWPDRNTPRA